MIRVTLASIVLLLSFFVTSHANEPISASPPDAKAYLISPQNGQTVRTTFTVQFGLSGMGIAPAGIKKAKTGHHHLLIDTNTASLDLKKPLPANDNIKHFGGGQSEATITLTPGKHTLQLLLGNYLHIPHGKPVLSEKITVFVK